jgi:hypothetical protein
MITIAVSLTADRELAKYERLFSGAERRNILYAVGQRIGVTMESVVSEYPTPRRAPLPLIYTRRSVTGQTYRSKFKSAKQQRKVFALIGRQSPTAHRAIRGVPLRS